MSILSPAQVARIRSIGSVGSGTSSVPPPKSKIQRAFRLSELSRWWGWSQDFLRPYFKDLDGVSRVILPENAKLVHDVPVFKMVDGKRVQVGTKKKRGKREYASLRIPLRVAQAVHAQLHPGGAKWFPPEDPGERAA
jgi:hypothetical protein